MVIALKVVKTFSHTNAASVFIIFYNPTHMENWHKAYKNANLNIKMFKG